ncbi:MAG: hypothetical protein IKF17_05655 [Clostridia bacterium]|nr:hypothetical protein [Clostridia bacterium]
MEEYEIKQIKQLVEIRTILSGMAIIHDINEKNNDYYRPVKNTSRQDCYKALYEINELVGRIKWH